MRHQEATFNVMLKLVFSLLGFTERQVITLKVS